MGVLRNTVSGPGTGGQGSTAIQYKHAGSFTWPTGDGQGGVGGPRVTAHAYGSAVVGYIRSPRLNDSELDVLEALIREYAAERGYNLVKVFREEGISSVAAWRPELEKLIRGLERHEWVGVVIPDFQYLSRKKQTAKHLAQRLIRSGAWLEEISDAQGRPLNPQVSN